MQITARIRQTGQIIAVNHSTARFGAVSERVGWSVRETRFSLPSCQRDCVLISSRMCCLSRFGRPCHCESTTGHWDLGSSGPEEEVPLPACVINSYLTGHQIQKNGIEPWSWTLQLIAHEATTPNFIGWIAAVRSFPERALSSSLPLSCLFFPWLPIFRPSGAALQFAPINLHTWFASMDNQPTCLRF